MRRTLILLISAAALCNIEALSLALPTPVLDACTTVDCATGLVCALSIPQSCNVSPCPKMPTCLPQNQTCFTNSCSSDETCVLRSVTCIRAPCYPVRECAKFPKCGSNEEYNECSLSDKCEPNCKDSFPICANVNCGPGACECKPGYFRHNGSCISKDKCPAPTCEKSNEEWNTCPSACTQTCRILIGKEEQMPCPAVCDIPQCTCASGFARDDDWNCVKTEDCPKEFKCDSPHEEYKECSSHCEPTCDNRSPSCIESCGPAKCQCKPNYVRHEGQCLFALQCPLEGNSTITPLHPIHDGSGSAESEESSDEKEGPSCNGVRCAANTVCSLKGGKPVCAKCGKNERLDSCPNLCSEKSCDQDNEVRCIAIKMCQQPRCICADGFLRNMKSGGCIKKNQCPTGDNSTMHILPIFTNRTTNPLIRPLPLVDPIPLIDPINRNGTMHIMPVFNTNPLVRPMFPHGIENETMHIMPHFENGTKSQTRPMFPDMHIMPVFNNRTNPLVRPFFPLVDPIPENETMHIMPVFSNWTKPLVRPMFPTENGTIRGRPQVRPMFPDNNGTFHSMPYPSNETMHIMPHFGNGSIHGRPQILPIFKDDSIHILPISENGTMSILPHFENGTNIGRPQTRPMFPDRNGTFHTLPYPSNETMHILPFFPVNNGSVHTMPVKENGTLSIIPFIPATNGTKLTMPRENGTMHILPFIPRNNDPNLGAIHIQPFVPSNASNVCANHTCPAEHWCEETPVMCITTPCPPIPTCVSVTPRGGGARDQPSKCGKNEQFSTCAPRCVATCSGGNNLCVEPMICSSGCVCKDKFKRDSNGVCVHNNKCWKSTTCKDNEIWHKCLSCEATCDDPKEMCTAECESGCGCEDGFVRGPKGDCIIQSKCPKINSN